LLQSKKPRSSGSITASHVFKNSKYSIIVLSAGVHRETGLVPAFFYGQNSLCGIARKAVRGMAIIQFPVEHPACSVLPYPMKKYMTRKSIWLAAIVVCLLLLVAALYFFNWNLARPYIAGKVTAFTGRSFAINGDLDVRLSLWPRIIANDVVMGNAEWSKDPVMVELKHADFRIDLLKLLVGRLSFPEISLSELHLVLEANKDGAQNWVFGRPGKEGKFPNIEALTINRGTLKFRDPTINTDLDLEINTAGADKGEVGPMVELSGTRLAAGAPARI